MHITLLSACPGAVVFRGPHPVTNPPIIPNTEICTAGIGCQIHCRYNGHIPSGACYSLAFAIHVYPFIVRMSGSCFRQMVERNSQQTEIMSKEVLPNWAMTGS